MAAFLVDKMIRRGRIPHRKRSREDRWNVNKLLMAVYRLA